MRRLRSRKFHPYASKLDCAVIPFPQPEVEESARFSGPIRSLGGIMFCFEQPCSDCADVLRGGVYPAFLRSLLLGKHLRARQSGGLRLDAFDVCIQRQARSLSMRKSCSVWFSSSNVMDITVWVQNKTLGCSG
jgi:hypothetical protein